MGVVGVGVGLYSAIAYCTGRGGVAHARYAVLSRAPGAGGYELRRYAPAAAAETVVEGGGAGADTRSLTSRGFRPLANFIFSGNAARESIAMTAPVVSEPARSPDGRASGVTVSFILPASHADASSVPAPVDPLVRVVSLPERCEAVATLRGAYPSDAATAAAGARLLAAARRDGLVPARPPPGRGALLAGESEPVVLRRYAYDPPWVPTFMRLNEVALGVEEPARASG